MARKLLSVQQHHEVCVGGLHKVYATKFLSFLPKRFFLAHSNGRSCFPHDSLTIRNLSYAGNVCAKHKMPPAHRALQCAILCFAKTFAKDGTRQVRGGPFRCRTVRHGIFRCSDISSLRFSLAGKLCQGDKTKPGSGARAYGGSPVGRRLPAVERVKHFTTHFQLTVNPQGKLNARRLNVAPSLERPFVSLGKILATNCLNDLKSRLASARGRNVRWGIVAAPGSQRKYWTPQINFVLVDWNIRCGFFCQISQRLQTCFKKKATNNPNRCFLVRPS